MAEQPPEVDEFLDQALAAYDLARCELIIAALRARTGEPASTDWADYLESILMNERDRDPGAAEHLLRDLAGRDQGPLFAARVRLALGVTLEYRADWDAAAAEHQRALDLFAQLGRHLDCAKVCKQIAITYNEGYNHGKYGHAELKDALGWGRRALAILDALPATTPALDPLKGTVWNTLGLIQRNLGQLDEAAQCYQRDLDLLIAARNLTDEEQSSLQHTVAISQLNLGEVNQLRGQSGDAAAERFYLEALKTFRKVQDRYLEIDVLANLGTLEQGRGRASRALSYYVKAIRLIEALRAGVTDEEARAGFFATMVNTFANAVLLCLELGDRVRAFDLAERSRARALLDVLGAGGTALARNFERRPLSLKALQAHLPTDAVLLAYFNTGLTELHERRRSASLPPRHRYAPERVLLFAVTAEDVNAYVLEQVSPNSLRPTDIHNVVERHFLSRELRSHLYTLLITPVEPLLRERRTVYIVPHGPLHYVPFHALIAPDGDTLLRADGPTFVYGLSSTSVVRPRGHRKPRRLEPCLTVGYNGSAGEQLRHAEDEARRVARLLGGVALVGPTPKEQELLASAHHYRFIHFCCHGTFNVGRPLDSALHIGPGEMLSAHDVLGQVRLHCELVTLSACESGLSRVTSGDELYGLARAFLTAGAPTILCPLWRVDDRSTRVLMEQFYLGVLANLTFAEALRRAQLFLRRLTYSEAEAMLGENLGELARRPAAAHGDWHTGAPNGALEERPFADPYFWAPFILIGKDSRLSVAPH